MNLLIIGNSAKAGSWAIRGEQLGRELGAVVTLEPTAREWDRAELVVLVKRAAMKWAKAVHQAGLPIIWDALDFWKQPAENGTDAATARRHLDGLVKTVQPALVIGATQSQARHAGGAYLPHHSRPGLVPEPARAVVRTVAYEGNPLYLGSWLQVVSEACRRRGWRFEINPDDLRRADILVALRAAQWDGWMCREWKSGVKLVNAIAAGRPVITQSSAAHSEIEPPGSVVESADGLVAALDFWADRDRRERAFAECCTLAPGFQLATVAASYRSILERQRATCTN